MSSIEKRKRFITNFLYWAIIIGLLLLFFRYLLGIIWPFVLAFLLAAALTPVIRLLTDKCHIRHSLAVALCLVLLFGILGVLVIAITTGVIGAIHDFIVWLPSLYSDIIEPAMASAGQWIENLAERIGPDATEIVDRIIPDIISSVGSAVTSLSVRIMSIVSGWVTKLPRQILYSLICVIATVFMTADFQRITAFFMRQLPARARLVITKAKDAFVEVLLKYLKSYGLIMCITFCELLVGLLILRQSHACLIALVIAVFDIFPVIGAGLFLLPWAIICLLSGSLGKGIGILAMYIIITVVREVIEPRIVGHQVGLHPLVTLIAMIIGTRLFGGVGLIGLPVACAIIKSLNDAGVVHAFRMEDDKEDDSSAQMEDGISEEDSS